MARVQFQRDKHISGPGGRELKTCAFNRTIARAHPQRFMQRLIRALGNYRYLGQVLEVPKDQYKACVQQMRDHIARGEVPGVVESRDCGRAGQAGHG